MTTRHRLAILVGMSLASLAPGSAEALTRTFDLVQAHAPCAASNTSLSGTLGGLACTPASPFSSYRLARYGTLGIARALSSLSVRIALPRVDDAEGRPVAYFPPFAVVAFSARIIVRTTDPMCAEGLGCTVVDRPVVVSVVCSKGRCTGSERIPLTAAAGKRSEIVAAEVRDDLGALLAVPGF